MKQRVAKLSLLELLLDDDLSSFAAVYPEFQEFLSKWRATIPPHSAHRICRQLSNGPYQNSADRDTAAGLAIDNTKGRSSTSTVLHVSWNTSNESPRIDLPENMAHNIAVKLKDNDWKFRSDKIECSDKYVYNHQQISWDFYLTKEQNLQFWPRILCKNARRFSNAAVASHDPRLQHAADQMKGQI